MQIKHLASLLLLIFLVVSCQDSSENTQDNVDDQAVTEQEQAPEQERAPEQNQQNPALSQQNPQNIEVSDEELQKFVAISRHVQTINQEAQGEMVNIVEEEGLDVQRFTEMQQAEQNPQQEVDATEDEIEKYQSATEKFQTLQVEAQQKMQDKIEEEGLSERKYQEISMAIQSDPELQERFRQLQE